MLPQKEVKKKADMKTLMQSKKKDMKYFSTIKLLMISAIINCDMDALKLFQENGVSFNIQLLVKFYQPTANSISS